MSSANKHKLHALCPYFAMFPDSFARRQILTHTSPGDLVLDPFSGRGTSLLESLLLDRHAVAVDINPVAACVSNAKARTPSLELVNKRIDELEQEYVSSTFEQLEEERRALPTFFRHAFYYTTLLEILFLRRSLDWRRCDLDCFVAALALGSLHGEMDRSPSYFSNQMPRTISTKPDYSVRYWQSRNLRAKKKRTFPILRSRANMRLFAGAPQRQGTVFMGDVRTASSSLRTFSGAVKAVITSPPYLDVTSYEEDQWLRLWFLGGDPRPTYGSVSRDDRHTSAGRFWRFLAESWQGIAPLLAPEPTIVCRIGGKRLNLSQLAQNLLATIRSVLPGAYLVGDPQISVPIHRQTDNFRPGTRGIGIEADFVLRIDG